MADLERGGDQGGGRELGLLAQDGDNIGGAAVGSNRSGVTSSG